MAKKRLNQILAIERDVKSRTYKDLTKEHHLTQKPDLVTGFQKTYKPIDAEGQTFPPEAKLVQTRVVDALEEVHNRLREAWDLTLTKDSGNQQASAAADIVVDGQTLVEKVPVATLLYLEKQLNDIHVFLSKLPTLPTDEEWRFDPGKGYHITEPTTSVKTAKIQKPLVLFPATDKHPAQTQLITVDETVGHWTLVKHSGAIPNDTRKKLLARCEALQDAVKDARERANMAEVEERKMADPLFRFLFGQQ